MEAIIAELTSEHAREAALLWSLLDGGVEDDEEAADLTARIRAHLVGMRVGLTRGADPLAGLDQPLAGADLFPAAVLQRAEQPEDEDDEGRRAIAAAEAFR